MQVKSKLSRHATVSLFVQEALDFFRFRQDGTDIGGFDRIVLQQLDAGAEVAGQQTVSQ